MTGETDVERLFAEYKNSAEEIRKKYPDMEIIHFTVPLTQRQTGWKASIKKIIGKEIGGVPDNMRRTNYNEILVKEYLGKDPILDIAKIESTFPDGTRCSFDKDGKTYYSLVPEYTGDGGHLNEIGRRKVAEQFLLILANL